VGLGWRRVEIAVLAVVAVAVFAPGALAAQPSTSRLSLSSSAEQDNNISWDAGISADGRWAVFTSYASNLVPGDTNGVGDVFLRDRQTGQTQRISVGPGGAQADAGSYMPRMTADGRFVVFLSSATTLVSGGTVSPSNRAYRFDRVTGALIRLPLPVGYTAVSIGVDLIGPPTISDDGSRIAFEATSAGGRGDIFWWDAGSDAVKRLTELGDGTPSNGSNSFNGFDPVISGDGRWVAFTTDATNLGPTDTNGFRDVYVRNVDAGGFERVSVGSGSTEANLHSSSPAIDRDGCEIAFYSDATNLVAGDTGSMNKVFVRNRCTGTTEIASLTNAAAQGAGHPPLSISADGCRVTFLGTAPVVTPAPASGLALGMRDRCIGVTSRLDLATSGDPGTGDVLDAAISGGTGRYVAFSTDAANLVGGDTNGVFDTFVRDLAANTPPVAALTVTRDGQTVTADASGSVDPDGFVLAGSISYGDGSAAQSGLHGTHTYANPGTYGVSVTVTDADGASASNTVAVVIPPAGGSPPGGIPGGTVPPPPRNPAPLLVLDRLKLSHGAFAVVGPRGKLDDRHGSVLTVRLNGAATVVLRFERVQSGRRVKGHCRLRVRRGPACSLLTTAGTQTVALPAGTSTVKLSGRIGGRALAAGSYRLVVSARSSDGRRSALRTLTFSILRLRSKG
jgi:Tol biopolymer transport system component